MTRMIRGMRRVCVLVLLAAFARQAGAADDGSIGGLVVRSPCATVGGGRVGLMRDGQPTTADPSAARWITFQAVRAAAIRSRVTATGFSSPARAPRCSSDLWAICRRLWRDDWTAAAGRRCQRQRRPGARLADWCQVTVIGSGDTRCARQA